MSPAMLLSRAELVELTGYRQRSKQMQWLADRLKISPPLRADGLPVITHAQVEAALSGRPVPETARGPKWSKISA